MTTAPETPWIVNEEEAPLRLLLVAAGPARNRLLTLLRREWPVTTVSAVVPPAADQGNFSDIIVIRADDSTIAAALIGIPAVVMTEPNPALARSLMARTTPFGLLAQDPGAAELTAAVRAVSAGLTVLDPIHRATLEDTRAEEDNILTEREREVLLLMAAGDPNKTIGRKLGISEHTAKFHVGAILSKLGAQSRAEAVMVAARRGLVPL